MQCKVPVCVYVPAVVTKSDEALGTEMPLLLIAITLNKFCALVNSKRLQDGQVTRTCVCAYVLAVVTKLDTALGIETPLLSIVKTLNKFCVLVSCKGL